MGPILAVLILGIAYRAGTGEYIPVAIPEISDSKELSQMFLSSLPKYIKEVGIALCPILAFFLLFQFTRLHLKKGELIKICVGLAYTCLLYTSYPLRKIAAAYELFENRRDGVIKVAIQTALS